MPHSSPQPIEMCIRDSYVVGDRHSNNSKRLAQIGKEQGIPHVYLIDDVYGIEARQLEDCRCVAVTSGASTPTYQMCIRDSIKHLKSLNHGSPIIR